MRRQPEPRRARRDAPAPRATGQRLAERAGRPRNANSAVLAVARSNAADGCGYAQQGRKLSAPRDRWQGERGAQPWCRFLCRICSGIAAQCLAAWRGTPQRSRLVCGVGRGVFEHPDQDTQAGLRQLLQVRDVDRIARRKRGGKRMSFAKIAAELNRRKISTRTGAVWHTTTVKNILRRAA